MIFVLGFAASFEEVVTRGGRRARRLAVLATIPALAVVGVGGPARAQPTPAAVTAKGEVEAPVDARPRAEDAPAPRHDAWGLRANGPFELGFSYGVLSNGAQGIQLGFAVDAHLDGFWGPITVHGEAGLGFLPALACVHEGEDGCGMYGRARLEGLVGPALKVEPRTRLFIRAGASAGIEGHPAYGLAELQAPRVELGFATWRSLGAAPFVRSAHALTFVDVALSSSYLVGASAGNANENIPKNGTIGGQLFTVIGPSSIELRLDATPDGAYVVARTRACVGVFGIACVVFESMRANIQESDQHPARVAEGRTLTVTVGGGGAFALEQ